MKKEMKFNLEHGNRATYCRLELRDMNEKGDKETKEALEKRYGEAYNVFYLIYD